MNMPINPRCFSNHLGEWAIKTDFLQQAVDAIKAGLWKNAGTQNTEGFEYQAIKNTDVVRDAKGYYLYSRTADGVAIMQMTGAMQKGQSKFGGVSTIDMRKNIRAALDDSKTKSILLVIDSPGGTVAGTQALGDDIAYANTLKPVIAHFEDLGASAAYWIASQARQISANKSAIVGSLGTYGVVVDSSGKAEMDGIKVHVISTGEHKGAFVPGTKITDEQLQSYQLLIDDLNGLFKNAVMGGRNFDKEKTNALFDGRVHVAKEALKLGLIDKVQSLDTALNDATRLARANKNADADRLRRTKTAGAKR